MAADIDLKRLAEPFPAGDIEWRVSRSGNKDDGGIFCLVFAYITARAISNRLDEVVGPSNWCNTPLRIHKIINVRVMQVGISILIDGQWVTKYDVSEPTEFEPGKGGFSGAMKRAGSQWGIGRYLYHLSETFAETSKTGGKGWEFARLKKEDGGAKYYWKPPQLPAWALPIVSESGEKPITKAAIEKLYFAWRAKLAPAEKNRQTLAAGFQSFVNAIVGEFPIDEPSCWTQQIVDDVRKKLDSVKDGGKGPDVSVPFN